MSFRRNIIMTAILILASLASSPASYASNEVTASRLAHAKELLGKYYSHSAVRGGELLKSISAQVYLMTERSMKASTKGMAHDVAKAILSESRRYELDPLFISAVIQCESSFNPQAKGSSGEIGLMQLMPDTAKWIAKKYHLPWKGRKSLRDPITNIRIGAAYFDFLRERFDNHSRLYLSAYNMGVKNVYRALERKIWPRDYAIRVMKNYVGYYAAITLASDQENKR